MRREAARNRMVPNRMVPVGGVRCSHHNGAREDRSGLPRGHARLTGAEQPRGTRPPVDLQKRKMWGRRPGVGPLQASKSGLGAPQGQRRHSGGCFFRVSRARVPRADVTRFFWEPNIRISFFRALNVQIVSLETEYSNNLFFLEIEYSNCLTRDRLSA